MSARLRVSGLARAEAVMTANERKKVTVDLFPAGLMARTIEKSLAPSSGQRERLWPFRGQHTVHRKQAFTAFVLLRGRLFRFASAMKDLLRDTRVHRLFVANTLGSIGSGVTVFAVPWMLVHRAHGSEVFRWATIGTTLGLFLFMPYYGAWVDRSSRKTMLLASEIFGFLATTSMAISALVLGRVETWQLVTV